MTSRSLRRSIVVACCPLMGAAAALAQPANDLCSNATVISSVPYASGNVNYGTATNDTGVNPTCDSSSNTDARQGVWWSFIAPSNGIMSLAQVASPSQDTATSIWTGACGALTQVACSDPESSTFSATGGVQYFILVSNWSSTNVSATQNVSFTLGFSPIIPTTDTCASPTVISSLPFSGTMLVDTATNDTNANPSCDSSSNTTGAKQGVWFSYTSGPTGAGLLLTESGSQDIVMTAWSGASCAALSQVLCSDSETNIGLSMPPNTTYLLMVSKFSATSYSAGNNIVFSVTGAASACCNTSTGACTLTTTTCGAGTVSTGGTSCLPDPCSGACCRADNTCTFGLISACNNLGVYGGNGSSCPPGGPACPASVGRCCNGATCTVTDSAACVTLFTGGGTCTTNLCSFPCCDVLTGTCSLIGAATVCSGVSGAGGATCSTITCAAPANDLCANAQVISGAGPFPLAVFGQNATAVDTAVLNPTITPCGASASSSSSRDVFYSFTPAATRTYTFTLCNAYTGTLDTTMSIHTACPATNANNLMCNDDGCSGTAGPSAIGGFSMTGGTTYIIRIARWSTGSGGKFQLDVTTEAFGACCDTSSVCLAKGISQCTSPNTFIGDGTSCATSGICNGACCVATTGACTLVSAASCTTGTHGGVGSTCTVTFCPTTTCCNDATGACTVTGSDPCASGTTPNAGATCSPTPCPSSTCCNDTTGACTTTGTAPCPSGTTPNAAAACTPAPCPIAGCCDDTTGICTLTGSIPCPSGSTAHSGVSCSPTPCPPPVNDLCSGAVALTIDGPTASGVLTTATGGVASSCSSTDQDLWYSVHVTAPGTYQVLTVPTGSGTGIAVFPGSPCPVVDDSDIACGAQSTTSLTFTGAADTDYLIRIADFTGDNVSFTVRVVSLISGACCNNVSGLCTTSTTGAAGCGATAIYQGDNSVCSPTPCVSGACCNALTGGCTPGSGAANCASGTTYQGDGTSCSPNLCVQPPGPDNDICSAATDLNGIATFPGTPFNSQTTSRFATNDGPVPDSGVCNSSGSHAEGLDNSLWYRYTPAYNGVLHIRIAEIDDDFDLLAVLYSGGSCAALIEVNDPDCDGDGTTFDPTETADYSRTLVAGTTYFLGIGDWGVGDGGGAIDVTLTFTPDIVPGVCCRGATCNTAITSDAACTASLPVGTLAGATFPNGTTCNGVSTTSPCCFPDYNKVGGITVGDIFDFLNDWFAGSKFANVGGDGAHGTLAVQNIFDFLNAWFAGGC